MPQLICALPDPLDLWYGAMELATAPQFLTPSLWALPVHKLLRTSALVHE
jgi:hypothetical protein